MRFPYIQRFRLQINTANNVGLCYVVRCTGPKEWSYTIEQDAHEGKIFYIIRVDELPGVCTDAESIEEGMKEIKEVLTATIKLYLKQGEMLPEPINKAEFRGNIAYRTDSERHFFIAKAAKQMHKSMSKTLDVLIDAEMQKLNLGTR
jgi:predicted RNase H-like HicB family nuclease